VDADRFPVLPNIYKVTSFPTIVLFKSAKPQHYDGVRKAIDVDQFLRMIKVVNKDGSQSWIQDDNIFGPTQLTGDEDNSFMDRIMAEAEAEGQGEVAAEEATGPKPAFLGFKTH